MSDAANPTKAKDLMGKQAGIGRCIAFLRAVTATRAEAISWRRSQRDAECVIPGGNLTGFREAVTPFAALEA